MTLPRDPEAVRVLAEKLAREHVAVGGKVVGYLTPCVPSELIEAAGVLPMMLAAGPETSATLGDRFMEDLFDTALRGVFERLLKGEFSYLSAIVLPRANDSAHRLYYYVSEIERTGEAKLPPVLLADVAMTPDNASRTYSINALAALWDELQDMAETEASDRDLRAAIEASNRRGELLEEFVDRRRGLSGTVTGAQALAGFAAARMLPGDVFEEEMQALLDRGGTTRTGPRVIICGSAHDGAGLHGLIEGAGGIVVGDYHATGELSIGEAIDKRKPPLEAIADSYRVCRAASRSFRDPGGEIADFAKACGAEAAVFSYFGEEEALTWDYPEQKRALEGIGVKIIRLNDQTRPFDVDANRSIVEALTRRGSA